MSIHHRGAALLAALSMTIVLAGCGSSTGDAGSPAAAAAPAGDSSSGSSAAPTSARTSAAESPATAAAGETSAAPGSPGAPAGTDPEAGAYPVTIDSALGSVTLTEQPQRIATWGWSAQDDVLALGLVPVAMPNYSYGGNKDQVLPWDADAIAALGGPTPALLNSDSGQTPFEQFAAEKPDVILAPYSGLTQEDYDTLSRIAPVIAYPEGPWATPWQDQLTIIGKALGLPAKAAAIKDEIDSHITDLASQHPELTGTTFLYGAANQPGQLNVYRATDPRVELLTQLGMTVSPSVAALDNGSDAASYFYPLSYEKLGDIDTDVLVAYFGDQAAADEFAKTPAVAAMASVQAGRFAPIIGESYVMASSAPSALSIPWMLDRYVPELAKAVGK